MVNIPVSEVQSIAAMKGIERIDATHTGKPLTDISVKATKVSEILNKPAGAATSQNGKGVMICIIDWGFEFIHSAFTDGNGNSRIKCVYLMDKKTALEGHKQLTYTDPNAGEVTAPGYYYDTPEGIKALPNTDGFYDFHGTHTAGIAAGTKSEQGFTGMAPEADIMLIPINLSYSPLHIETFLSGFEKALMFAVNYAKQKNLNLIISMSLGCHEGPHNGTGTIPEMLNEVAKVAIPVMSTGNEGSNTPHIYKKFSSADNTIKACISAFGMDKPEDGGKPDPFTLIIEGYDGLEMDLWATNKFNNASGYTQADNELSASDWVSIPNIISVGAYCTNTTARRLAKNDEDQSNIFTLGDIAHFSSYGHFSNDVKAPTVCAPGVNIVASYNSSSVDNADEPNKKASMMWKGSPYESLSGTSMACPHVAGIVALWLQAKPGLTFEQVMDALKNSCDNDEFTAKTPIRWGYGKINAQKGLNYLLSQSDGIEEVNSTVQQSQSTVIYDLQGRQVANPTRGIYIVGGRKVVIK